MNEKPQQQHSEKKLGFKAISSARKRVSALDNRTFKRHLAKMILIPVVLMGMVLGYTHFQSAYRVAIRTEVAEVDLTLLQLVKLEKLFTDMETGVRGFTLSGKDEFLEPYHIAQEQMPMVVESIFRKISGSYELNEKFRSILSVYAKWFDYAEKTIQIRKQKGEELAKAHLIQEAKGHFDGLRDSVSSFEQSLSEVKAEKEKRLSEVVELSSTLEIVFIFLFLIMLIYLTTKQLRETTQSYRHVLEENLKNMQEVQRISKSKDLFLANMSHEIRTPLGAIVGFADLLAERTDFAPEERGHLLFIKRNSHHLLALINDLFDLSKLTENKLEIVIETITSNDLMSDLLNMFSSVMTNRSVSIRFEVKGMLPSAFKSDPVRLKQILANLIGNAVKFSRPHTQVTVVFSFQNETLVVDVIDQGVGIPLEARDIIFEAFHQAQQEHSRNFGGVGLGLSISKKLAQHLKGDLRLIDSRLHEGSHFRLEIPIEPVGDGTISEYQDSSEILPVQNDKPAKRSFDFSGKRVLLVEDAKENQILFKIFVEPTNAEITVVDNGSDAVRKALNEEFDLVLMDIQMPGLDGYQAMQILRDSSFDKKVIALTAHAMKGEREKCLKAGFDDYLSKPVTQAQLLEKMNESFGPEVS